MIIHLTGQVIHTSDRYFVLETNGVGYKIFATTDLCLQAKKSKGEFPIWTHQVVREDALDLFGFQTHEDLSFFEQLISISGIGPKGALGVMNVSPTEILKQAIAAGDTTHLTKVSGIGKKLADKIVLELKDKVDTTSQIDPVSLRGEIDALEALKAIGYDQTEAREALKQIPSGTMETKERIRQALKILGK